MTRLSKACTHSEIGTAKIELTKRKVVRIVVAMKRIVVCKVVCYSCVELEVNNECS